MKIKRTIRNGGIVVRGRRYVPHRICTDADVAKFEGKEVFVDEDGVLKADVPRFGLRTVGDLTLYWLNRFEFLTVFFLEGSDLSRKSA